MSGQRMRGEGESMNDKQENEKEKEEEKDVESDQRVQGYREQHGGRKEIRSRQDRAK